MILKLLILEEITFGNTTTAWLALNISNIPEGAVVHCTDDDIKY